MAVLVMVLTLPGQDDSGRCWWCPNHWSCGDQPTFLSWLVRPITFCRPTYLVRSTQTNQLARVGWSRRTTSLTNILSWSCQDQPTFRNWLVCVCGCPLCPSDTICVSEPAWPCPFAALTGLCRWVERAGGDRRRWARGGDSAMELEEEVAVSSARH